MMMRLWPKKLSWLKWVVVWLVVVLICWLLKTYGVYDWVYARLIRKPSDATPDNLAKPTKVDQDTQTEPITTRDDRRKKESREKKQPGAKASESTSSAGTNTNLSLDSQSNPPQLHPTQANSIPSNDANAKSKSQESARSASSTEVGVSIGLEERPEEQVQHLAPVQEEDEDVIDEEDVMNVMDEDEKRSGEGPEEQVQHLAPVQEDKKDVIDEDEKRSGEGPEERVQHLAPVQEEDEDVIDEDEKRSGEGPEEQVQHLAPVQEEDEEEEVSSQPSTNTKLIQTQPPNPTTPDAPLVKCLQEIHMIKKHEDHRWVYDSNLSKWDLYLDENAVPELDKYPRYLILYTTDEIPASRCQEYIEQLSLLNRVECIISTRILLLRMWQGQGVFKLILILLRTFDTPDLVIEVVESLFDPNSIQTEEDPTELNYLLEDVPEKMKTRRTALLGDLTWTNAKWEKFHEMIWPTYPILARLNLTRVDTTQPNPTQY